MCALIDGSEGVIKEGHIRIISAKFGKIQHVVEMSFKAIVNERWTSNNHNTRSSPIGSGKLNKRVKVFLNLSHAISLVDF